MSNMIGIDKLSQEIGVTSRTLRHWESQGLFESQRDSSSGWRMYDEQTVLAIRITALLRGFDIGIKEIKVVLADMTFRTAHQVMTQYAHEMIEHKNECIAKEITLKKWLEQSYKYLNEPITAQLLLQLSHVPSLHSKMKHEVTMPMGNQWSYSPASIKFVTLPPMRMASHVVVSASPEEEAIDSLADWLVQAELQGTARLFGKNEDPLPDVESNVYGYGAYASIPENIDIPSHLAEVRFSGGVYAMMESTDDITGSWHLLMEKLNEHPDYEPDSEARFCLEEHIRNDNPAGSSNAYWLQLFEPVRKRIK